MFVLSLTMTLGVELVLAFLLGVRNAKGIVLVLLVNVLTNPFAVLINWMGRLYISGWNIYWQIPIELLVILVEATIYFTFSKKQAFKILHPVRLALVLNVTSWLFGVLLNTMEMI